MQKRKQTSLRDREGAEPRLGLSWKLVPNRASQRGAKRAWRGSRATNKQSKCGPEPPPEEKEETQQWEQEFVRRQSLRRSISHISSVTSRAQNQQLKSGKDAEDSNSAVRRRGLRHIHWALHSTEATDKHGYFSSSMNIYEH